MGAVYSDEYVTIECLGPLGALENNAHIVRPRGVAGAAAPAVVIDAPEGSEKFVCALSGIAVSAIVITHAHRDHWAGLETLQAATRAPVHLGEWETGLERIAAVVEIELLAHGAAVPMGKQRVAGIAYRQDTHRDRSASLWAGRF